MDSIKPDAGRKSSLVTEESALIEETKRLLNDYKTETSKLKLIITNEREDRQRTEEASLELLKKVRVKYDQKIQQIKDRYEQQLKEMSEKEKKERNAVVASVAAAVQSNDNDEMDLLKMKLGEAEMNLIRKENEISSIKLDMKIYERDAGRAQEQVKYLREMNRELKEKIGSLEAAAKLHMQKEQKIVDEIESLKKQIDRKQKQSADQVHEFENKKLVLEERIKTLEQQCQNSKDLERGLANWQGMYEECKRQNESILFKNRELENEKRKLRTDLDQLKEQLRRKDESLNKLRLANTKLKDTCLEQEKQLEMYQSMYDGKVDEYKKAMEDALALIQDQDKVKNELRNVQETLRNEIKQKEELELRLECEKAHFEKQLQLQKERIHILENSLDNESDNSSQYVKEITCLQADCSTKNKEIKRLVAEMEQLKHELLNIKEEASQNITTISNLRSQNQSLTKMYDEINAKYNSAKNRICDLLEEIDLKDSTFENEKLRLHDTINQQFKLIDHLQTMGEKPTKKVSWFGHHHESKNTKNPISVTLSEKKANHVREIESALERERAKNKTLLEKIAQNNIELLNCKKELKRRYDLEAKAIIESSCSPNKKRNVGIYENLIRADQVKELLDSKLSMIRDEEMSPSAPPLHHQHDESKSNSSMTTAEATEEYYSNRNLNSGGRLNRSSSNVEEEFTFTDSMLDELAYNKS